MTTPPNPVPLSPEQQAELDVLCEALKNSPHCEPSDLADVLTRGKSLPQQQLVEELLVVYCRRAFADRRRVEEQALAHRLGCDPQAVRRAKRLIAADHKPDTGDISCWTDRYQFQRGLGRGGFGRVGLYRDTHLDLNVAIKLPRSPREKLPAGALAEARKIAQVRSTRVVQVRDVGYLWDEWDDPQFLSDDPADPFFSAFRPAIVMEYADRSSLHERITSKPWELANVIDCFPEIARGVADVHNAALVHRDLKPKNILFGSDDKPRVSDFGLAESWLRNASPQVGGTPKWMAPEVLLGWENSQHVEPARTQDVWSLGVILYQLLTGQHPFTDSDWKTRIATANYQPVHQANPILKPAWQTLLAQLLHPEPNHRCSTVDNLLNEFDKATGGPRRSGDQHTHNEVHHHEHIHYHGEAPPDATPAGSNRGGGPGSGSSGDGGSRDPGDFDPPGDGSTHSRDDGFDRRAARLFVGHEEELDWLDGLFGASEGTAPTRNPDDPASVAFLHGMPGCGKTYLIDRWLWRRRQQAAASSPVPVVTLTLERNTGLTLDSLCNELSARWKLPATEHPWATIRRMLADSFLRVENVDSEPACKIVVDMAHQLDGCRIILSGRWMDPGQIPRDWQEHPMPLLSSELAQQQFQAELREEQQARLTDLQWQALLERTGRLPLAIHLACGYLNSGHSLDRLLERLPQLTLGDMQDPRYGEAVLAAMAEQSLSVLQQTLQTKSWLDTAALLAGFRRLGHGPLSGMGRSVAAAIARLEEDDLDDLLLVAGPLHLIEREPESERFRIHPLLAEQVAREIPQVDVDEAITDWFCHRLPLPMRDDPRERPWVQILEETDALLAWLPRVPDQRIPDLLRVADEFAVNNGPYAPWIAFCERAATLDLDPSAESDRLRLLSWVCRGGGDVDRAFAVAKEKLAFDTDRDDPRQIAEAATTIGDVHAAQGRPDEALEVWNDVALPAAKEADEDRSLAMIRGRIADVLFARGELDEALRIRREEQLPVYERLGDVREKAVTQGKIADVLQARGELDEALRIRREKELPVFERLGDVSAKAVTQGQIADVLQARGELDEALRIFRGDVLPVFERLGDVRAKAVTQGKIADVLQARGELDEALRIFRGDVLPVFERLGDVSAKAVTQGKIADVLQARGELDEALRIRREEQLPVYERLGDVRAKAVTQGKIADVLQARGELDEALRIRREKELPVYERLGDVRAKAVTQGKIADVLQARGELDEALRIRREKELPVYERLGDVRAKAVTQGKIADVLQARGELDEALRIRREEQLPVYERLGDVRAKAVTQGKIADVLQARGELDEALRIFRGDVLPVFERLGDVRAKAVTQGKIADVLQARGELDEALRIRREEQLPVYERLGDVRAKAVTQGQIADVLFARGELDEALRIRREEQLPVYERLGDVREKAVTQGKIADVLQARGELDEALRIRREEQLPVYERLGDVREKLLVQMKIADFRAETESVPAAVAAYRKLEPEVEKLGNAQVTMWFHQRLAMLFVQRGEGADFRRAREHLQQALDLAETMKLPDAETIRQFLRRLRRK